MKASFRMPGVFWQKKNARKMPSMRNRPRSLQKSQTVNLPKVGRKKRMNKGPRNPQKPQMVNLPIT